MLSLMKQVPPKLFTSLHGCLLSSTKALELLISLFSDLANSKVGDNGLLLRSFLLI